MEKQKKPIGTEKYIVGEINRFDQKNEMFKRAKWQPENREFVKQFLAPNQPKEEDGYTILDLSFREAGWYIEDGFGHGLDIHNTGLYSWDSKATRRIVEGAKYEVKDDKQMSRNVKSVARDLGASEVGICKFDKRWVYSHSFHWRTDEHKEFNLPDSVKYVVVLLFEMDYAICRKSPTWHAWTAAGKGYSDMAYVTPMVAQFIRSLGYLAIPSGNDSAISIPYAIDAGLGELGRHGMLITPLFGPRVRIGKVFTDMPLFPDKPIEFGVMEYCKKCKKCAKMCPLQCIQYGERTTQPNNISNASGQLKWPIDAEKCFVFWARNQGSCMNCIRVCPFNKPKGVLHTVVRWFVKNASWLDSFLIKMDDLLGYGKQARASKYWDD